VIVLLGNHELVHIYSLPLSRGEVDYSPGFERKLAEVGPTFRAKVLDFLNDLPFFVRTAAGVMVAHVGPSPAAALPAGREVLAEFDHRALIEAADAGLAKRPLAELKAEYGRLTGGSYDEDAAYFLAVTGPDDPRYRDLLRVLALDRREPAFGVLWETFFSRNERGVSQKSMPVWWLVFWKRGRMARRPRSAWLYPGTSLWRAATRSSLSASFDWPAVPMLIPTAPGCTCCWTAPPRSSPPRIWSAT
jgi:hypothetical protein